MDPTLFVSQWTLCETRWLRRHNREFGKHLKVIGVEGVDSLNTIGLHGGDDLQVEYVSTRDRVTPQ
jgi:hypothetical protein